MVNIILQIKKKVLTQVRLQKVIEKMAKEDSRLLNTKIEEKNSEIH